MDSIFLNGFSLEIFVDNGPVEKVPYRNFNYFALPDKSEYVIKLGNDHGVKTDAHVWIDNEKIGVWRINSYSKVVIESPANINRKLVLLKEGTINAKEAGIQSQDNVNGLIKIIFKPEKLNEYIPKNNINDDYYQNQSFDPTGVHYLCKTYTDTVTPVDKIHRFCAMNDESYSRYITATLSPAGRSLGDNSQQRFRKVEPLENIDDANITTLYARLVVDDDKSTTKKTYISLRQYGKMNNSTPIPPPLNLRHHDRPYM